MTVALVAAYLVIALGWVWIACAFPFCCSVLVVVLEGILRGITVS